MSFLFISLNIFAQDHSSASAPLVGELGDFKPGTSRSTCKGCSAHGLYITKWYILLQLFSSGLLLLFLLTFRKHLHHGYKACSAASKRNLFPTSFWAPMQRPTTNYFEKSLALIPKSTKLIFVILHRFSISPLQGISLLAETICLVQTDLWSWSLCPSWNWELRFQGMGKVPHRWCRTGTATKGLHVHEGSPVVPQQLWDWEFSDRARLPPSGFTLAVPGLLTELWEQFCSLQNICWGKSSLWGRKSSMWYIQK